MIFLVDCNNFYVSCERLFRPELLLSPVIVLSNRILFKKPTFNSKPIANIESGRLFVLKKCKKDWCEVSSLNYTGWINMDNVWGKD